MSYPVSLAERVISLADKGNLHMYEDRLQA